MKQPIFSFGDNVRFKLGVEATKNNACKMIIDVVGKISSISYDPNSDHILYSYQLLVNDNFIHGVEENDLTHVDNNKNFH